MHTRISMNGDDHESVDSVKRSERVFKENFLRTQEK